MLLVGLALAGGCGAQVVVRDDGAVGEGGAGGSAPTFECIGECGGACVKCIDGDCADGRCDAEGQCVTRLTVPACDE